MHGHPTQLARQIPSVFVSDTMGQFCVCCDTRKECSAAGSRLVHGYAMGAYCMRIRPGKEEGVVDNGYPWARR